MMHWMVVFCSRTLGIVVERICAPDAIHQPQDSRRGVLYGNYIPWILHMKQMFLKILCSCAKVLKIGLSN